MKTFLKLISIMTFVLFTQTSLAEPAAGTDPNLEHVTSSQAGTMVLGSDLGSQAKVCVKCQDRNKLKLTDTKDNFQPGRGGSVPASTGGSSNVKDGDGRN